MPVKKINISEFLTLAADYPVLDVRSPAEYAQAHIPGALSLPLFDDEERKQVGTAYKQKSREEAIKIGLDYFGVKMRKMVEEAGSLIANDSVPASGGGRVVLVHCWRGGMRSAGVAWLLDLYGFKVYTLAGGYKTYRNWVLQQFEKEYSFNVIGGYTGSGKTGIITQLQKFDKPVIDLENLACHKGSAFGAVEGLPQPRQEMFENLLAENLVKESEKAVGKEGFNAAIFLEDESQRIGNLQLPMTLWETMRKAPVFFIDIPFEERLSNITIEYGVLPEQYIADAITRIKKRLGGLDAKNALQYLADGKLRDCFDILLRYYDKYYHKGLYNREHADSLIQTLPCGTVDAEENTQKILSCHPVNVS